MLQHNFSIDSILDGLIASDEPAPRNLCAEEVKQVVTEESIKVDGKTGNLIEKKHVFSLYIVCSEVNLQMTLLSEI